MQQYIIRNDRFVTIRASAGALIRYKSQFGAEYEAQRRAALKEENDELAQKCAGRPLWAMAAAADESILPPEEFSKGFSKAELAAALVISQEVFASSLPVSRKKGSEPFSSEQLIALALTCGFDMKALDELPISMVISAIEEYLRLRGLSEEEEVSTVTASQSDYDRF